MMFRTEQDLASFCLAIVPESALSLAEKGWCAREIPHRKLFPNSINSIKEEILAGGDPLGDTFSAIRSAAERRKLGQVYTPNDLVTSMVRWVAHEVTPTRIVDVGAGSGRFARAATIAFPNAEVVAVESDPLAALMLRASALLAGLADRINVVVDDYRNVTLPEIEGPTAFIGNPPYVRHHQIPERWKKWYTSAFNKFGIKASALAGLHLYFYLKTMLLAKPGDVGTFITASEWLDVNYGSALRKLLMSDLGAIGLHVLQPTIAAFPGTATTATITCFRAGERKKSVLVRSVAELENLNSLSSGIEVPRSRFLEGGWSIIVRGGKRSEDGKIPLGDLFDVHRGQVTGANWAWIAGEKANDLPLRVLIPSVTKAKDIIEAGERLTTENRLKRVVDLPVDLDTFSTQERVRVNAFLKWARDNGAHETYVAQHRKAWWSVGLKAAAPILCTYMARRTPQFTLNACEARHINIAHGLYPRQELRKSDLARLVTWLNRSVCRSEGRTYAGGLTKFEPKELERILIPTLEALAQ